jgi:hypothetical protein
VTEVDFLWHRITQEGLKMDDHKVKTIVDWEPLKFVCAPKVLQLCTNQLVIWFVQVRVNNSITCQSF